MSASARPQRPLGRRHFYANLLLFTVYCALGMALTWIEIRVIGQHVDSIIDLITPFLMFSAFPVVCIVNWKLTRTEDPRRRLLIGIVIGLTAIGVAFLPFMFLIFVFWGGIGGTL